MKERVLICGIVGLLTLAPSSTGARGPSGPPDDVTRFSFDRGHSAVEFVVRFMGLSKVRGRFSDFSGAVVYDRDAPERSTVALAIDVASIDTDNDMRDDHLRSPDWFDAERWPRITFRSRSIERTGPDAFVVTGPLTIKETTREVSIPITRLHGVQTDAWGNWRLGFEGALTIDRKDYGVEGHNFFNRAFDAVRVGVSDEVRIEFTISGRVFNMEKIAYRSRDKPSIGETLEEVVEREGIAAAVERYHELASDSPEAYEFAISELNKLGYKLLQRDRVEEALEIFRLNLSAHPESAGALDSLAEAYAKAGDYPAAIEHARRSLGIEPGEPATMALLQWLERRVGEPT